VASDEVLKQLSATLDRFDQNMTREHKENRRFQHEIMKRLERWSIAVEARMAELGERVNEQGERVKDQGELIRAQTEALYRILDRLPPATS
jgi:hypothetical protein